MGVHELTNWIGAQHDVMTLGIAGAFAVLAVLALLKLVGLVRRLMWSFGLLIAAGSTAAGGGWDRLHALTQLR